MAILAQAGLITTDRRETTMALLPCGRTAANALNNMKPGQKVWIEAKLSRNPQHNAKYFAILNEVFQNQEQFASVANLREATLIEIGESELREKLDGTRYHVAKSMKFGSMPQAEFERVYNASLDAWAKHFGFDMAQFEKEAMKKEGI